MNINYDYYKIFYVIAKNKNITKAAKELNISQPAISRMLKTMEEQINSKLFIRNTNGVILTSEGKKLYSLISDNISNIMNAEIQFSKIINNKDLTISVNPTILNYFINTNKIDKFLSDYNNIRFIDIYKYDLLNNQLINNLIDFGIIIDQDNYKFDDNIESKNIDKFHTIFVSSNINNINTNILVLLQNSSILNQSLLEKLSQYTFKNIIYVDNYDNLLSFLKKDNYCGFVFKESIVKELDDGILKEISIDCLLPTISLSILYNKNNKHNIDKLFN